MTDFAALNRRAAIGLGAATALVPFAASAAISPLAADLDRFLRRSVQEDDLAGVVALTRHGRIVFERAYGLADRDHGTPNRIDTRFNLASINKMFTATAIMRLVEAGKVKLEDPLSRYLADWPDAHAAARITITQLLSHSSGIGNFWEEHAKRAKEEILALKHYLPLFASKSLEFAPGSRFGYSNGGYIALGLVIESVTGQEYHTYVRDTIFRPLGMVDTDAFRLDRAIPRRATGYARADDAPGEWNTGTFVSETRGSSAGGGYSTAHDLLRFADAYRSGKLMTNANRALATTGKFSYSKGQYGFGFSVDTVNGHRIVGHSGGHYGSANELLIFEDLGWTAVILTNCDVDACWGIIAKVKDLIAGPSPATKAFWHTRELIEVAVVKGEEAAVAFHANSANAPRPRSSVIEVAAAKHRHRRDVKAGDALDALAQRYAGD